MSELIVRFISEIKEPLVKNTDMENNEDIDLETQIATL